MQNNLIKTYETDNVAPCTGKSSAGWLLKWHILDRDTDLWIKTPGYIIYWGGESYAECLVSAIAKDIGISNCLQYRPCIVNHDGKRILSCESYNFIPSGYEFISYQRLMSIAKLEPTDYSRIRYSDNFKRDIKRITGLDISKQLADIISLDSLVLNYDRNFWNFGLLVNKHTRNIIPDPIFDSGDSLDLPFFQEGEFNSKSLHTDGRLAAPFNETFDTQYKLLGLNTIPSYINSINFKNLVNWFSENCSKESNLLQVVNPIPLASLVRAASIVDRRLRDLSALGQIK